MIPLTHTLLYNPRLNGVEYGSLRAFEDEIARQTSAHVVEVPYYPLPSLTCKFAHGTRYEGLRQVLPKQTFRPDGDVLWYILMGPESYELDLFKNWEKCSHYRIAYLFDTLEPQYNLITKLFSDHHFNICITSFTDAAPKLQELTGNKWHVIEQAIPDDYFKPVSPHSRLIDFSSYGRRHDGFHRAVKEYCDVNKLYYDFSVQKSGTVTASHLEAYRQYAWHLTHSKFTISWPVEITNPARAGSLNPVTCRWFEAAAAATPVIGKKPANTEFDKFFYPGMVTEFDPEASKQDIWKALDNLYAKKEKLLDCALKQRAANLQRWTWKDRVERILQLISPSTRKI